MNRTGFSDGFAFHEMRFQRYHHTDNRQGAPRHYLAYMRKGTGRLVGTDRTVDIASGDFLYIPFGYAYQSYWQGDGIVLFDSYGFRHFPLTDTQTYPMQRIQATPEALACLERLAADKQISCTSIGYFYQLLGCLLGSMKPSPLKKRNVMLKQAESYMQEHTDYQIGDVAAHCGVSESGLYAAFRAEYGCTPIKVKHRILAEKAIDMLTATDMSIESICSVLGFHSAPYFRKVFMEQTGKTPRQIRKERHI